MSKEMRFNLILFAFACTCFFYVIPTYTAAMETRNDFGPQLFPKLSMAVVALCSLALIVQEFVCKKKSAPEESTDKNVMVRYFQSFASVLVYVFAVSYIGFYTSSFALAAIYFRRMPKKKYAINMFVLLVLFVLIWFMFERMMKVDLPSGLLF